MKKKAKRKTLEDRFFAIPERQRNDLIWLALLAEIRSQIGEELHQQRATLDEYVIETLTVKLARRQVERLWKASRPPPPASPSDPAPAPSPHA